MHTTRAILFIAIGLFATTAAYAQEPGAGAAGGSLGFSGQAVTVGPRQASSLPRPLFTIGNLPVGIWAPVPPPYDINANRNGAANPLP